MKERERQRERHIHNMNGRRGTLYLLLCMALLPCLLNTGPMLSFCTGPWCSCWLWFFSLQCPFLLCLANFPSCYKTVRPPPLFGKGSWAASVSSVTHCGLCPPVLTTLVEVMCLCQSHIQAVQLQDRAPAVSVFASLTPTALTHPEGSALNTGPNPSIVSMLRALSTSFSIESLLLTSFIIRPRLPALEFHHSPSCVPICAGTLGLPSIPCPPWPMLLALPGEFFSAL